MDDFQIYLARFALPLHLVYFFKEIIYRIQQVCIADYCDNFLRRQNQLKTFHFSERNNP